MSRTVDAVIDELGGTLKVSVALGLEKSTVSGWRKRGLPPGRWPALVKLAAKCGKPEITFEALAAVPPPPNTEAAA